MATNQMPGADAGSFVDQFKGLDFRQPGQWALGPKLLAWALTAAAVVVLGYVLLLSTSHDELDGERGKEPTLKADYRNKLGQAVNREELQKQKLQVEEYVTQLEKQLPGKAEMDALLSDINQAGLGRGLQFELFRPGSVVVKDYYAELPITIRVAGKYHDIGAFSADIANLSRIVTLHDLSISAGDKKDKDKDTTVLVMDATARTYRYLDQAEIKAVKDAANATKGTKATNASDASKAGGAKK